MLNLSNLISKEEEFNIIHYLDSELKTWSDNKTLISFYDANLKKYGLDKDFFEQLYFKLKKNIESKFDKNFLIDSYYFIKYEDNKNIENNIVTDKKIILSLNNINLKYQIVSEWSICKKDRQTYSIDNIYKNDMIFYYKEFIKDPKKIIKKIDSYKNWQFYSTKELNKKPFETSSYEFSEYQVVKVEDIGDELLFCINDYENNNNIKISRFTDIVATKSYPGKLFGAHVDSVDINHDPDITIIVDLNDNFDGGEIYFNKQNFLLKPYAGSVLIYPSKEPYYHSPSLINFGNKISCIMYGFIEKEGEI